MIRLDRKAVEAVHAAASREDLYPWLQNAIELEHSTIPPYLTAMFSLKPGTNDEIARPVVARMTLAGQGSADGEYRYSGGFACDAAGRYGFGVRVLPAHTDLATPSEMGCVAWA